MVLAQQGGIPLPAQYIGFVAPPAGGSMEM